MMEEMVVLNEGNNLQKVLFKVLLEAEKMKYEEKEMTNMVVELVAHLHLRKQEWLSQKLDSCSSPDLVKGKKLDTSCSPSLLNETVSIWLI